MNDPRRIDHLMPLQACNLPPALQWELDMLPAKLKPVARNISLGPSLEARCRLWIQVPIAWRDEVAQAVALQMGAMLGTKKPFRAVERAIAEQVPPDLRARVHEQALRVYEMGMPKPWKENFGLKQDAAPGLAAPRHAALQQKPR